MMITMSKESPFSNPDQAVAEFTADQKEQQRKERDLVLENNRESFIANCVERAEELSDEQVAFASEYLRTHSGTWQSYDDQSVYVSTAEIRDGKWIVEFCVCGERDDESDLVTESIPLHAE